jgi:hypothetical protein
MAAAWLNTSTSTDWLCRLGSLRGERRRGVHQRRLGAEEQYFRFILSHA